jgi:hypothetical protein
MKIIILFSFHQFFSQTRNPLGADQEPTRGRPGTHQTPGADPDPTRSRPGNQSLHSVDYIVVYRMQELIMQEQDSLQQPQE